MMRDACLGVATVAAIAVALAGCSSRGGAGGATGGTSPRSTAGATPAASAPDAIVNTVTPDQAAIALLPPDVKSSSAIDAGVIPDIPPLMFVASNNQLTGVEHDLLTALGKALGKPVNFHQVKLDALIPGITSGRYLLGAGSITDIKAREEKVDIVDYAHYGQGLATAPQNPANLSFDSLCGHAVGATRGSVQLITYLPALSKTCVSQGRPKIDIRPYPDLSSQFLAVSSKRVDGALLNYATVAYYVKESHGTLAVADKGYKVDPKGVLVSKSAHLSQAVVKALQDLTDKGVVNEIFDQWGLKGVTLSTIQLNGATH